MSLVSRLRSLVAGGRGLVQGLSEEKIEPDPIVQFERWFAEARRSERFLAEAMMVATCTRDGVPSARMMLLKGADERGFVFYTNYSSRKGRELDENPHAALVLHWKSLQRQVRIEGVVERLTSAESEAYFRSRPRGSQLGAWASEQSSRLTDRAELEGRMRAVVEEYEGRDVPLPPFWGGYRLQPSRIEFWQGRLDRLHDRLVYRRVEGDEGAWRLERLSP